MGAGPGDEGLITVRGLDMLRRADVVVYDDLANPRLLLKTRPGCEQIPIRPAKQARLGQDRINALLVDRAEQGNFVVRLKGGDPYLFGRGAEEVSHVASRGIACEVVPGVTAGIAAPTAAGIPITRRDLASTVTFVTGHEDPAKREPSVDYRGLASLIASGGSVCFYMAMARLSTIAKRLCDHGLKADTAVAVVQWGFTPRQRSVRTTLSAVGDVADRAGLTSPAIIVVGPVAAAANPGLDFYTSRPMFGRRIVITRTRRQASELGDVLHDFGAEVLEAPTIELHEPDNWRRIDEAIRQINQFDWLVLTSVNGVEALARRLEHLALDSRNLAGVHIAVIGDATEHVLKDRLGIVADLVPPSYVGESLAEQLTTRHNVSGKRILMLRADIARTTLHDMLTDAGARITELAIYETRLATSLPDDVVTALRDGTVDWITFTSSSTARNMIELLGPQRDLLERVKTASIGPITSATLRELGCAVDVEAHTSNIRGLVDAMVAAERIRSNQRGT